MKMSERLDQMEARIQQMERKGPAKGCSVQEMQNVKRELNRQAQYAKKDHMRMFGVEEKKNEDCRQIVSEIISRKLKVKVLPTDLSAAHRVKKSKKQQHRPIIIRFKDRTQRFEVLKNRKLLKGSGVSLAEDMTIENMNLIKDAEDSGMFESAWFWNGKVLAKDKDKKTVYTLNLFDDFEEIVSQKESTDF